MASPNIPIFSQHQSTSFNNSQITNPNLTHPHSTLHKLSLSHPNIQSSSYHMNHHLTSSNIRQYFPTPLYLTNPHPTSLHLSHPHPTSPFVKHSWSIPFAYLRHTWSIPKPIPSFLCMCRFIYVFLMKKNYFLFNSVSMRKLRNWYFLPGYK